jgi:hypothetical protein
VSILKELAERKVGGIEGWNAKGSLWKKEERSCERLARGELPDLVERGSHEHRWNAINTEEDSTR